MGTVLLGFVFCLLANQAQSATQEEWSNFNKTLGLSFTTQRNQTGHYVNTVFLDKMAADLPENMRIDVKSSITTYGGSRIFQLKATITVPPQRPADYELFHGVGYYKFYPNGAPSFRDASATCAKDGAHLAILNSAAEYDVLKTIYARHPDVKEFAYIGFHLIAKGKFVTIFGDPLETTGFLGWKAGEPNQVNGNEHCGSVHRDMGLNDLSCVDTWPFFCEYDLSWNEL